MKRMLRGAAIAAAAALLLSGCSGGGDPLSSDTGSGGSSGDSDTIIVGSADFAESQLIATIYSKALQNAGVETEEKLNIGSREVYMEALKDGSIDLLPEYNGYLLAELQPDTSETDREVIKQKLVDALPDGIVALDAAEAENQDVLVVPDELAKQHDLENISDLEPLAGDLTLAGPAEWKSRYIGVPGLEELYGLKFKKFQVFDAGGPLTLAAMTGGQADVGMMFSSDPAIAENGLTGLVDDKGLFLPANVLPIIRESKADDTVQETLNAVSAALTMDDLMDMNGRIAAGEDLGAIADDWIAENDL